MPAVPSMRVSKFSALSAAKQVGIVCGGLTGLLLTRRMVVRMADGRQVSPTEFEREGGKGSSKKWKVNCHTCFHLHWLVASSQNHAPPLPSQFMSSAALNSHGCGILLRLWQTKADAGSGGLLWWRSNCVAAATRMGIGPAIQWTSNR